MKARTIQQVETAKKRAVNFVTNVLGDPDRAAEIEDESLEDYAARKRIQIIRSNPAAPNSKTRLTKMPRQTKADELQGYINQVGEMISDALDPVLTREELVQKVQEMDAFINGDDDDSSDDDSDDDSDDEAA